MHKKDDMDRPHRRLTEIMRTCLRPAVLCILLSCLLPAQARADTISRAPEPTPFPVTFMDTAPDLSVKVWGGNVVIQRGYEPGMWYSNLDWKPLRVAYDSLDNTVKTITRGNTEYSKAAPGVYQDQNSNILRQTDTGYRWNDPHGNWIEYNLAGEIKAYGNRNGTVASFLYSGPPSTMVTTTNPYSINTGGTVYTTTSKPSSEGRITGILDHYGTQILWFDYNSNNDLIRIRDATGRKVEYQWTRNTADYGTSPTLMTLTLSVLDTVGNTWNYEFTNISGVYSVAAGSGGVTPPPPDSACKYAVGTKLSITGPEGHKTDRSWYHNGALALTTYADGSTVCVNQTYDDAKKIFYYREIAPGGKLTETWSGLKQDLTRGEYLRKDINGVTVAKQSVDTASRTTTKTDARGLNTAQSKDQWGNVTRTVYPDGSSVSDQYDPAYSNVTKHTDENGIVTQNTYDTHGNLLKTVEALGLAEQRTTEYIVDADGQRISQTRKGDASSADAVTRYEYDTSGNVITVTDAEGGITRYTYDIMGNALSKTDPRGKLWKRSYDNRGHLLSAIDPLNRTSSTAYDKIGLPISLTDAAGNISTLSYDATGKRLSVTDPYGGKTRYSYDVAGNPISITDAESHIQKQEYDLDGHLVKQIDGNNNVTQFIYGDAASGLNGLLVRIIYPTLTQDLQYDQRDRIIGTTDSATGAALALDGSPAQTTRNQYDRAGRLTAVTDPANRSTGTKYNALGQIIQSTDPANGATKYGYDTRGNLTSVTDAKGNTHRFEYDRLDRMVKEIRPLGQTIAYAYDANGNLIQVTDPKGQAKKYTYDNANRRTQENHYLTAGDATPVKSISYTYNDLDRLTGYADGNTTATYSYDARQLRQTGESVNYGTFSLATSTSYNALGQKSSLTYPDGAQYSYTYDSNNQLSTVNLPTGFGSITFNSYTWTVPDQITLPGGTVRIQQYDGLLRLKDLNVKDPGQSQVMSWQYGYDLTSNITTKATEKGTTSYSYDMLDRLTAAAYTNTAQTNEAYTYDPVANRITDSKTAAATWTYNENNQLISAGSISYTYDDNGNTINQTDASNASNTRNFVYDIDNRLIEVHDANNAIIAVYSYDPFGRRLSKDVGTQKTYYLYNAEGLIAEADTSGQITRSYGYAPDSTYSTNLLWLKTGTAYYTYQNDHLGTPMKLLNQSGVVVWSATYDSFGRATVDAASTVKNNLRYPGQYEDQETGLHYNWNRYYSAREGRYITSDPIGVVLYRDMAKLSLAARGLVSRTMAAQLYSKRPIYNYPYIYVRGDPVSFADPMGLWDPGGTNKQVPGCDLFPDFNKCATKCCDVHDSCYEDNACNALSWLYSGGVLSHMFSACARCNHAAAQCLAKAAAKCEDDTCPTRP